MIEWKTFQNQEGNKKKKKVNKKISSKEFFLQNFLRERETIPVKFRLNSSSTYKTEEFKT